jgi:uncharacterized protein YbaP (TraB family)
MMFRAFAFAIAFSFSLTPAAAQDSCGGVDLLAKMKREEPARHAALFAEAKAVPFGDARFYRIQKKSGPASWLFGTMHVSDPRALAWVDQIEPQIRAARAVALENVDVNPKKPNPVAIFKMAAMMPAKPGELLAEHLDAKEVEAIVEAAAPRLQMSSAAATRLRPWPLIIALAYPACEAERAKLSSVVDSLIQERAEKWGKPALSLETIEGMLGAITSPSMAAQVDILRSSLATYRQVEDYVETLTRALDRGETGLVMAFAREETVRTLKDPKNWHAFMDAFIDRRNETMFRSALPLVEKGGAFLAVGALHLPGEKGLAQMFRNAGYEVTPIMLKRTTKDD